MVAEPLGGAHRGRAATMPAVGDAIEQQLRRLLGMTAPELRARRREKFLKMGQTVEA